MYLQEIDIQDLQYSHNLLPYITVFHQKEFLNIYKPYLHIVGIFNAHDDLTGIFFYFKKTKFGISYIIPLPFQPYNGLIFNTDAQSVYKENTFQKKVHQQISDYFLRNHKFTYIRFQLSPNIIDTQVYQWNKWRVKVSYIYHLDLGLSEEDLFKRLASEKRQSIRKAEKDGVRVVKENHYTIIKPLILNTFKRQHKKISEYYLDKILFEWANDGNSFAYVAYFNEDPVACTFFVYDDKHAYYLLGGYEENGGHYGAGTSCMWHSILYSKQIGVKTFDFNGSMLPAVEHYFRGFGAKLVPFYVCEKYLLF